MTPTLSRAPVIGAGLEISQAIMDAPRGEVVLEAKGISKRFPGVLANDGVSFSLRKGEIHALLGENGAGKTTLMNILYGLLQPDEGVVLLCGKPVAIRSPQDAMRLGIGMVHQHFKLFDTLSVAENIFYGLDAAGRLYLSGKRLREETSNLLNRYNLKLDPDTPVWQLPVGVRQKVELAKTLFRGAKILLLDEPTAVLTPQETRELFDVLRVMTEEGHSIIFITHKLEEVLAISQRITVLKNGRGVSTLDRSAADKVGLARMMVSREVLFRIAKTPLRQGEVVLYVENLWVKGDGGLPAVRGCTFAVSQGEILAIAGVAGNGQKELVGAITGLRPAHRGSIQVGGEELTNKTPREICEAGVGVIPEDRAKHGLILDFTVEENMILNQTFYPPFVRLGFLNKRAMREHAANLMRDYDVYARDTTVTTRTLSGGNLQKVLLARELSRHFKTFIVSEPTRGLDIGATEYVRQKMLQQREKGVAILLVSSDLEEIMSVSDRVAVLFEGELAGVMDTDGADLETIGLLMTGGRARRA